MEAVFTTMVGGPCSFLFIVNEVHERFNVKTTATTLFIRYEYSMVEVHCVGDKGAVNNANQMVD